MFRTKLNEKGETGEDGTGEAVASTPFTHHSASPFGKKVEKCGSKQASNHHHHQVQVQQQHARRPPPRPRPLRRPRPRRSRSRLRPRLLLRRSWYLFCFFPNISCSNNNYAL